MADEKPPTLTRRQFASTTAVAALSAAVIPRGVLAAQAPSNRLNIAGIGVGGMGASNLKACEAENIVALCGEGVLYQEFLRLKSMLEAEGLFNSERKRPIPEFPKRIGIVTSPTGAALRDMLNTLGRRLPLVEVLLAPSPVQGTEAPPALVKAIQLLNRQPFDGAQGKPPDVILVARGGGSIEDLWAFNDERVVRAVAASAVPVISGVGHERRILRYVISPPTCARRPPQRQRNLQLKLRSWIYKPSCRTTCPASLLRL